MNGKFLKLLQWLGKHGYLLAAFLVPLVIRSIPEGLSWPFPIGLDTLNLIPAIKSGWVFSLGPIGFLHNISMFYLFAGLLYALTHNIVFVLKFLGPVLMAVICGLMFLYARKGLSWSNRKSLLVSILTATYFVALRDSWDLYRQATGLIFLMATLISLKSFSSPRKYYIAGGFAILTVLSHQLAAVIMFFVILVEAAKFLIKKSPRDTVYLLATSAAAFGLFLFQMFSFTAGMYDIPSSSVASGPSIALTLLMAGLLVYCYVIILPLVLVGLRGLKISAMHYWAFLCLGVVLLEMVNPNLPLFFWNRWVYLLVYPLLFFVTHGFERIWKFWSFHKSRIRRLVPKVIAISYLVLLLTLSGFYLTASPENQISFFSTDNHFLTFIPSSMLQNTLPISDNPSLKECFEWINNNSVEHSSVVIHYALEDLAVIYVNRNVTPVYQNTTMLNYIQNETTIVDGMVAAARTSLNGTYSAVYTVWWVSGKGWYGIPSLPAEFREVFHTGNMAVYLYDQNI